MIDSNKCCGCWACANICPTNSISMKYDDMGFAYPSINISECIDCKRCEKVCPCNNDKEKEESVPFAWGGYIRDKSIRDKSSSGGIFTAIALPILKQGGVVFGASFSEDNKSLHHIAVECVEDMHLLRNSKYVQSEIGNTFSDAKKQLVNGRKVLFSGTPCQIDGLMFFLGKEYDNLFTVEVICHGVPSPQIYKNYIEYHEKCLESPIESVSFRSEKDMGALLLTIRAINGKIYCNDHIHDPYYKLFLNNYCLRESCYKCPSKGLYRRSDITLGDFWGVEKYAEDLIDGGRISLVLLHSSKGKALFEKSKDLIIGHEVAFEKAIQSNIAFFKSYKRPRLRSSISYDLLHNSIEQLANKYCKEIFFRKYLRKLKKIYESFLLK